MSAITFNKKTISEKQYCFCLHNSKKQIIFALAKRGGQEVLPEKRKQCENSSVGRAQPCQGWGRGFESRFSLNIVRQEVSLIKKKLMRK